MHGSTFPATFTAQRLLMQALPWLLAALLMWLQLPGWLVVGLGLLSSTAMLLWISPSKASPVTEPLQVALSLIHI